MSSSSSAQISPDQKPLQQLLIDRLTGLEYPRRGVTFLLGSDELIDHERRVALTPEHMVRLRQDLETIGLTPRLYAIAGAGERAADSSGPAFRDDDYRDVDVTVVDTDEAAEIPAVDLVHALKEPTLDESLLRGPLIRIGALHLASKPTGLCRMLGTRNFAAILDGGTVGYCSYLLHGGDRTPIVGSMSRFAGSVAGRKVVEGLAEKGIEKGRVIVVGGGIAGLSAIGKLGPVAAELLVVEPWEPTREKLEALLPKLGFDGRFRIVHQLTPDLFDDAAGIVFAHRSGAKAAEKVCSWDDVRRMRRGAAIADIAIDQGGSIAHDDYREEDDALASLEKYRVLLADFSYYAETNMPREEPHEASENHGDASLPYVTALLALCALHGGPGGATEELLRKDIRHFQDAGELAGQDLLDCLTQDLRNGLQLVTRGRQVVVTDPDIERDERLADWVRTCAS